MRTNSLDFAREIGSDLVADTRPQPIFDGTGPTGCRRGGRWYIPTEAEPTGVDMLDAYIIDRIRRERESRDVGLRLPLQVEVPPHQPLPEIDRRRPKDGTEDEGRQEREERGVAIIDFGI